MSLKFSIIFGILLLPEYWVVANVNMFKDDTQQQFKGEDATPDVFGSDYEEIFPVAYFDLNADKLTDILCVSKDRTSINMFLAYKEPPFIRRAFSSQTITQGHGDKKIISIRPGDFNGNGLVDLMVTLGREKINYTDYIHGKETDVDVIFCSIQFKNNFIECPGKGIAKVNNLVQEPMTIDLNGDMVLDLFGEIWVPRNSNNDNKNTTYIKQRMVWFSENLKDRFGWREEKFRLIGELKNEKYRDMTNASSNAFGDIDGDGAPELIVLTEDADVPRDKGIYYLETYSIVKDVNEQTSFMFKKPPEHVKTSPIDQTKIMGQPIVIDMEHKGKLVHLIPFCSNFICDNSGIYVINQDNAFSLPMGALDYDGMKWSFIPPQKPPNITESANSTHHNQSDFTMEMFYSQTVVLRVGDYNLDGYPDLLGVLKTDKTPGENRVTRAVLFENVKCEPNPDKPCYYNRTFNPNFNIFKDYKNVISASFYDIKENGVLDVILVMQKQKENQVPPQHQEFVVRAFQNEMNFDSSFIKVMVLTGQQCLTCEFGIPYGNVLPGATIKYGSVNSQGLQETGVVVQTYRTAHMPLDLPCEIFGIGQSPNFVDSLSVEIAPNVEQRYRREWLQIIPNSQVVVIPNPVEMPNRWDMKLFLTPSDAVLNTFGVLVGICLVLATMVAALEYKERREDRLARQSEAHRLIMY